MYTGIVVFIYICMFLFYRLNDLLANELALKMEIKNLESTIMELEATNQVPIFNIFIKKFKIDFFMLNQFKIKLTFGMDCEESPGKKS